MIALGLVLAASFTDSSLFQVAVTALLSGGAVAAWVSFRKAGPEIESISVSTMKDVIGELRAELTRLADENEALRKSNQALQKSVEDLQTAIAGQGPH